MITNLLLRKGRAAVLMAVLLFLPLALTAQTQRKVSANHVKTVATERVHKSAATSRS